MRKGSTSIRNVHWGKEHGKLQLGGHRVKMGVLICPQLLAINLGRLPGRIGLSGTLWTIDGR